MLNLKHLFITLPLTLIFSGYLSAQNINLLFSEGFEGGAGSAFDLNLGGGSGSNQWVINDFYDGMGVYPHTPSQTITAGNQGVIPQPNGFYLHIRDHVGGPLNNNFHPDNASNRWAMMNTGLCTQGYTSVSLNFWWLCSGSINDFGEVYYSTDGGNNWLLTTNSAGQTKYKDTTQWTYSSIEDTAFAGHDNLLFAFRWLNDGVNTGDSLPFAIDEVAIVGKFDTAAASLGPMEITSVNPSVVCHNDPVNNFLVMNLSITDTLCAGDYRIELSDSNCSFDNPTVMGSFALQAVNPANFLIQGTFYLPTTLDQASCYCWRINRISAPTFYGTPSSFCFTITDCQDSIRIADTPAVLRDPVGQMNVCRNSVIDVPFFSYGGFNSGNDYTLELSNAGGSFSNPTVIAGPVLDNTTYDTNLFGVFEPGVISGQLPAAVATGCNYYIRVSSSDPAVSSPPFGPFCIDSCDVSLNNNMDLTACVTFHDSMCFNLPLDINTWGASVSYGPGNEFEVQLLDADDLQVVNQGLLGSLSGSGSGTLQLCVPDFEDLGGIPLATGDYYLRVKASESSDITDQWSNIIRMTINGIDGRPLSVSGSEDTVACLASEVFCFTLSGNDLPQSSQYEVTYSNLIEATYTWQPPNPPLPTVCFNPANLAEGTLYVSFREKQGDQCSATTEAVDSVYISCGRYTYIDGDLNPCAGDTVTYTAGNVLSGAFYQWYTGSATVLSVSNHSTTVMWPASGMETVSLTVVDPTGSHVVSDTVSIHQACVWPGDTDNDLVADNNDLLPIGVHFGLSGISRNQVDIDWRGHGSADWGVEQANGWDAKFADCNGDGMIDAQDTMAIVQNYSLIHSKTGTLHAGKMTDPVLSFYLSKTVVGPGEMVSAPIMIGDDAISVNHLYGLAFDIQLDPALIDTSTVSISYQDCWLDPTGTVLMTLTRHHPPAGKSEGVVVKTDHEGNSGTGQIAILSFQTLSSITTVETMDLEFTAYLAVDTAGAPITLNVEQSQITIDPSFIGIPSPDIRPASLEILPNPFQQTTRIRYTLPEEALTAIRIYDLLGKQVFQHLAGMRAAGQHDLLLDARAASLSPGIYMTRLEAGKRLLMAKLVVIE